MTPLLEVDSLHKRFTLDRHHHIDAVNDVSFTLERGQTLGLVGESGSGKTTVGRCLLRLIEPTSGRITFDGVDVVAADARELRALRARMRIVFQDPYGSLNPRRTIEDTVLGPLRLHGELDSRAARARVEETLAMVGLRQRHATSVPRDLTTSEQQRAGIARALVTRPDLIVLDEPTSALDMSTRAAFLDVMSTLQQELQTAFVLISHDLTAVERASDEIAIMYLGRIVERGAREQVTRQHRHPYSRALLSAVLHLDPARPLPPLQLMDEIPSAVNMTPRCPFHGRCPAGRPSCAEGYPPRQEVEPGHEVACFRWRDLVGGAEPGAPTDNATDVYPR